jgi:hypothetical protein
MGRGRRRDFTWIVGGDEVLDRCRPIVIEIHPKLKFQIVVPKDHGERELFTDNIDHFLKKVATKDELRVCTLGFQIVESSWIYYAFIHSAIDSTA